jgi:beta-phosphoglucomutase
MLKYSDFLGVIFDIDDTLLNNLPRDPLRRLHERSRLAAIHEIGKKRGIKELTTVTPEENLDGWLYTKVHSLEGAIWHILEAKGLVQGDIDHKNELLLEIARRKDELHEKVLREEGEEVAGASDFVRTLAEHGFEGRMAIASTAVRRDIDIFLDKVGLASFFPEDKIISKDKVTRLKPHPEAFELAFAALGLSPEDKARVLVFEDDPRGVTAAKAAGMYVCVITTGYDREVLAALPTPPDLIADSFDEFHNLLGLPGKLKI